MLILSSKIDCFFSNQQQSNARGGQKKNTHFFGNARPKYNERAHLKQRKNIVAITKADRHYISP